MAHPARSLAQVHLAVLLFGVAGLLGDRRLSALSPLTLVFGRVSFASLALLAAVAARGAPLGRPGRRGLAAFAALGALLALHWLTFFRAVHDGGLALALLTYSTFPVFVAFLEPPLFGERLRAADVLLAAAAAAGVAVLVPSWDLGDRAAQGALWGLASGLTFALLSLLNRKLVRGQSGLALAFWQDLFAAVVLLPFALARRPALSAGDVLLLAVLGVLCTAVAHALFIGGLRGVPARTAGMIACLEPVYGIALAAAAFGDVPKARTLFGGALILGVALYATLEPPRDRQRRGPEAGIQ